MAQVKKDAVRDAILTAAQRQFVARGYVEATLSSIAKHANVTTSNIYNYFPSKLAVLYALYEPWLTEQLDVLAAEAAKLKDPRKRLQKILIGVLHDIPRANNCFANNVLQALSTLPIDAPYSTDLLLHSERRVARMIGEAIAGSACASIDEDLLAHLLFMAFDGFAMHYRIASPSRRRVAAIVDMLVRLVLGDTPARALPAQRPPSSKRRTASIGAGSGTRIAAQIEDSCCPSS